MIAFNMLTAALVAAGIAVAAPVAPVSAAGTDHSGHGEGVLEMSLNHGRKWQTDEPLRVGMSGIRAAVAEALPRMHGGLTAAGYAALADRVQGHLDDIVTNCRLPEEADLQLHVAVAEIYAGIDLMKEQDRQPQGVVTLVRALDAYGEHFEHPGWQTLAR
jgi:hypothetical protein